MTTDIKLAAAKAANKIRKSKGLPELSLAFWEEDLHPRGQRGRFAPKGSSGGAGNSSNRNNYSGDNGSSGYNENRNISRYGEFNGESYDREEVQREIVKRSEEEKNSANERLYSFLKVVAAAGGVKLALMTGHPIIAALLAGYVGIKVGSAILKATTYAMAKYTVKGAIGAGKIASAPAREVGRGVYDAVAGY